MPTHSITTVRPSTRAASAPDTVVSALRATAGSFPNAPAVVDPDGVLTYSGLWSAVDRLAAALPSFGISRGDRVGVAVDRSRQTLICLLALARMGASYVPLDRAEPEHRLASMVAGCAVRTILGQTNALAAIPSTLGVEYVHVDLALRAADAVQARRPADPTPDDLLYVIHTSGSTGDPKGVCVPHGALVAAARSLIGRCGIHADDRILSFASLAWDTAGEEIYSALLSGATLVIDRTAVSGSVTALLAAIRQHGVTVIDLPTSFWYEVVAYLEEGEDEGESAAETLPPSLRLVIIGGEEVRTKPVRWWAHRVPERVRLLNTYGQTETALVTHAAEVGGAAGRALRPGDRVPIGLPMPHVVERLQPADGPDAAAELFIGGPTVASGYAGKPRATAERFVPGPDARAGRFFRTGDLVRRDDQGRLVFVGRLDRQVKVRGHRVEPEEVERVLHAHPGVIAAAVVPVPSPGSRHLLHAAIVPADGQGAPPAAGDLRSWLALRLPSYLRPDRISYVSALPLLPNGKVDIAMIASASSDGSTAERSRSDAIAGQVAEFCGQLLGAEVAIDDDFFNAGGDSLLATRLISRVYRKFDVELTYLDVFEHRTPGALAEAIGIRQRLAGATQGGE